MSEIKIGKKVMFWIAVGVLILITFWLGYIHKSTAKVSERKTVPVEVEAVRIGSIERTIELTGWVKADAVVDVKSKVPGRIESLRLVLDGGNSVAVEEGLTVKKGQQLCVVDHDVYLTQVNAAKASVKASEVELADAEREKNRISSLFKGGSATEQSKDKAVTAADLAVANLNLARANLELAEINLRESTIVSPIDGVVTARYIDEGNLINAGDQIVTIADIKTVKVVVAVAEKYGAEIAPGVPARIRVDAFGEKIFNTKVYSVYPALDTQTHTVQVEIRLANDELLLKPGMFARVTLITDRKDNVVVILRDVVLGGKIDETYVYVVEGAIAHKRIVRVGIAQADRYEITEGLKTGERLVVNGMTHLEDGAAVEVLRIEDIK